jgi:hypothetical protein
MNITYHENYWLNIQCWLLFITKFTLLNKFSCTWYAFSESRKKPEIPEMTISSQGMDCPDCRLALVKTGKADGRVMYYCKERNACIMQAQHMTSIYNALTYRISKL